MIFGENRVGNKSVSALLVQPEIVRVELSHKGNNLTFEGDQSLYFLKGWLPIGFFLSRNQKSRIYCINDFLPK